MPLSVLPKCRPVKIPYYILQAAARPKALPSVMNSNVYIIYSIYLAGIISVYINYQLLRRIKKSPNT
jgi:hypothetical protein